MTKKTHVVCANALALAVMRPTSIKYVCIGMVACSIGSVVSDLDITTTKSHKEMDKIILFVLSSILLCIIGDYYYNFGIYNLLLKNTSLFRIFFGCLFFLLTCFYGMHKPHRSFLHSILGVFVLSSLCNIIFSPCLHYFLIGICSHIFLDLFNKKSIQLFFPFKDRYCFKFCDSDGFVNKLLGYCCSVIILFELIFIL